jgi:hypothetical protein
VLLSVRVMATGTGYGQGGGQETVEVGVVASSREAEKSSACVWPTDPQKRDDAKKWKKREDKSGR